jgi:hypothetical protein
MRFEHGQWLVKTREYPYSSGLFTFRQCAGEPSMFVFLGFVVVAVVVSYFSRQTTGSVGLAEGLMAQADACAGTSPHRAQTLRTAAMACLSVVGQR